MFVYGLEFFFLNSVWFFFSFSFGSGLIGAKTFFIGKQSVFFALKSFFNLKTAIEYRDIGKLHSVNGSVYKNVQYNKLMFSYIK